MPYESFPFSSFGAGLNLRDKTDAVSEEEAIDCLNVFFTERGAVRQRDGYGPLTTTALTNRVRNLAGYYTASGTRQLLAGCGTRLEAINTSGGVVASATALTDGVHDFARFGSPNADVAYAGQGDDLLRKWDGSAWSSIASTPKAGALAVLSPANRLVAGRFNGTTGGPTGGAGTSSPSHVYFSDAGDPETWGTNNYIQLTPGDGEKVQAVIAWRDSVFIFKETKFFVVYGESTDAGGDPIFNYRTVDAGAGLATPRAVASLEDGVYFMDRRGVFRTAGGDPERLSDAVDPIFLGGSSEFYSGGELLHSQLSNCAMGAFGNQVYLAFTTKGTANNRVLVFDPRYEWWSLWDLPASAFATFRVGDQPEIVFGASSGDNHVHRHSSSYTSDNGTAVSSHWRSGWFDLGSPVNKTIREAKIWGTGTVDVGLAADYGEPAAVQSTEFGGAIGTTPRPPGTVASDPAVGTVAWTNPSNAAESDGSRASADFSAQVAARDEFDQTAGNLHGKTLPVGGTWDTSLIAGTDYTVNATENTAQRTSTSDINDKFALAGASSHTSVVVRASLYANDDLSLGQYQGIAARVVDANNWIYAIYYPLSRYLAVEKRVAGVWSEVARESDFTWPPWTLQSWHDIALDVDTDGNWALYFAPQGELAGSSARLTGQDSDFATGGALASGKAGMVDFYDDTNALTRRFDNFVAWDPTISTQYLKATNLGFGIPLSSTIRGVEVTVERRGGGLDDRVRIVKGGVVGSTDKSNALGWAASDETVTYGGSTDLWGETWEPPDINATDFGVVVAASMDEPVDAEVDSIKVIVYYTGPPNPKVVRGISVRGTVFSTTLANDTLDTVWNAQRLEHHIREARPPSVRRTET